MSYLVTFIIEGEMLSSQFEKLQNNFLHFFILVTTGKFNIFSDFFKLLSNLRTLQKSKMEPYIIIFSLQVGYANYWRNHNGFKMV